MIIGIGGVSRSGKSDLAQKLCGYLGKEKCAVLDLDDFVLPQALLPEIKGRIDWESPETINWALVFQIIEENQKEYLIIEGIFAFSNPYLVDKYDLKIIIRIPKELFIERRKKETRWGPEPRWYIEHVWETHEKSGISGPLDASFVLLDGSHPIDFSEIIKKIR